MKVVSGAFNFSRPAWSDMLQRKFDSLAEMRRGEELKRLEMAGEIMALAFQPRYELCKKPRISYTADFRYRIEDVEIIEDVKGGPITRDARTRIAWAQKEYGIIVHLIRMRRGTWEQETL